MSDLDVQNINSKTGNSAISIADDGTTTVSTFTSTGIDDNATSTAVTLDASGNVGIGTITSSYNLLEVNGDISTSWGASPTNIGMKYIDGSQYYLGLTLVDSGRQTRVVSKSADNTGYIAFDTGSSATERMRIDSSGLVGINTTNPSTFLEVAHATTGVANNITTYNSNTAASAECAVDWALNRTGSEAKIRAARITAGKEQTWTTTASTVDGYLKFLTVRDESLNEAMRIDSSGRLLIGKTSTGISTVGTTLGGGGYAEFTRAADDVILINRTINDGKLVRFFQDGTEEGAISISGTTVTYGGGHLARWSQSDTDDVSSLYKGTVMSNLDEMCEWDNEDNEQLNKTKVSDVESDVNVAGVFVAEDNSDGFSDYWLAMTGDMIIRIAQGTTVQRGDLLISAGDGTAKPQDDDIVRSKTIAKVTSTNVTCTYADGSYCVPCVLMAC